MTTVIGLLEFLDALLLTTFGGTMVFWVLILKRRILFSMSSPSLAEQRYESREAPLVSIVVPVRNEDKLIERCLVSLLGQNYSNFELIVVDDSSTNQTYQALKKFEDPGKVKLVKSGEIPEGWVGKTWACSRGVSLSKGEILLFTDSDTYHKPHMLSSAIAYLLSNRVDVVSIRPRIECEGFWCKAMMSVLSTFLTVSFPIEDVNDDSKKLSYVFGSFILVPRKVYDTLGGHYKVRGDMVEDRAFGEVAKQAGYKVRILRGDDAFSSRWSKSFKDNLNAVERIVSSSAQRSFFRTVLFAPNALLALVLPFFFVLGTGLGFISLGDADLTRTALAFSLGSMILASVTIGLEAIGQLRVNPLYGLLTPVTALVIIFGIIRAVYKVRTDRNVTWRGRKYHVGV